MSDELKDEPLVALWDAPFHELPLEEKQKLVKELRARRTNAAAAKAERKGTSRKLQGKTRRKNETEILFNLDDLTKPQE